MKFIRSVLIVSLALFALSGLAFPLVAFRESQTLTSRVFLPLITSSGCKEDSGETYETLVVNPPVTDRPAAEHADLNLALRGYTLTTDTLGLVDYNGPIDGRGPKLYSLFAPDREPAFSSVSQVYGWDWGANSRDAPIEYPPVTLAGMVVAPNEALRVPRSEYNIGAIAARPARGFFLDAPLDDPNRFEVLVLYASEERITLKYTREDNVISGYTLHVENICIAADLLQLYRAWNENGRAQLPALKQGQVFGWARTNEIGVVIRDNGTFMDPRARKDWW
ncbi:MAG: hypothetical protein IT331_12170 [Anaerolineae bacterium]|nr:hypothetical protein [Anaerolineae bacterium]